MKIIGLIDYCVEGSQGWHAHHIPQWIRESAVKGFDLSYAWVEKDRDGTAAKQWCEKNKLEMLASMEELVNKSDCIVVLSPDNPEQHEDLCRIPLASGKPVFVDKTFAPDVATAKRIFKHAEKHNTPLFSSSALRFAREIVEFANKKTDRKDIHFVAVQTFGVFDIYIVHQLEMIVTVLGIGARRVKSVGSPPVPSFVIDYGKDCRATATMMPSSPFQLSIQHGENDGENYTITSDFFKYMVEEILVFFQTGKPPVPKEQTIEIMAIREACAKALKKPDAWIRVHNSRS